MLAADSPIAGFFCELRGEPRKRNVRGNNPTGDVSNQEYELANYLYDSYSRHGWSCLESDYFNLRPASRKT